MAAVAGLLAAWIGAGSMGLVAHPLRHALTWLALAAVLVAAWPQGRRAPKEWGILAVALLAGLVLTVPTTGAYSVLGVAIVLAVLARMQAGLDQRALLATAFAVVVFGVFRLACTTIPAVWLAADWLGQALGTAASAILGKPLWVGATLGGVDFLVLMTALYGAWLARTARPRWPRAIYAAAAILAAHLGYLTLLAYCGDLADALPVHEPVPRPQNYVPPPWFLSDALRTLLPWNVPALAGLIHAAVAACMLCWAKPLPVAGSQLSVAGPQLPGTRRADNRKLTTGNFFCLCLALLIPVATALAPVRCELAGRKIVAYDPGSRAPSGRAPSGTTRSVVGWSWDKPVHGRYGEASAGQYGMLPTLVGCLGSHLTRSPDLSEADLAGADLLIVIHPLGPWPEDRLQRVWDFVRNGGSLLVVAEPWTWEQGQMSSFDELLRPTSMTVRFDTAIAATARWQHALHLVAHPTTAGIGDQRGRFGLAQGCSIQTRWPARPLVVGRWGWSDPGSDAVLTGQYRFDPGERLGDLVLAAEQRVGRGTVLVVGDATAFRNEGLSTGYEFVGRLLAYLAGHRTGPQALWRQAIGLAGCLVLLGLLGWHPSPVCLAWTSLVLAVSLGFSAFVTMQESKVLPDGRPPEGRTGVPNCLACIDASHLESYRGEPWLESGLAGAKLENIAGDDPRWQRLWRDSGIGGLELNLMRNGYLPIRLTELTGEQLQRAGMLISIAPARPYSAGERRAIKDFLTRGGIWVCMVGADRSGPLNQALAEYRLRVPPSPLPVGEKGYDPTPSPHEHRRRAYFDLPQGPACAVLYSAWPVECNAEDATVLLENENGQPVAVSAPVGEGTLVLIGDSDFAVNRNLENDAGLLVEPVQENTAFWRWLIAKVRDRKQWVPPYLPPPKGEPDQEEASP